MKCLIIFFVGLALLAGIILHLTWGTLTWTLRKKEVSSQPKHREFTDEEYYMMRSCACLWYNFQWVNYQTDEEVADLYGEETGDWEFEHIEEVYREINKERRLREEFEEFKKLKEKTK